jgi:hypothetical protein
MIIRHWYEKCWQNFNDTVRLIKNRLLNLSPNMNKDLLIVIHTHNISIREYQSIVAFNIQYMQHQFSSVVGSLVEPDFLCSSCTWIKIVQLWWSRCFLEISDLPYEFKCLLVQVYQQYSHVLAKKADTVWIICKLTNIHDKPCVFLSNANW